ncbi:MAG: gamma-glutamylcyclotransferase [Acetobacteraceae bacterium]|nr:gamma-glutamylcyclotransferase [Acetobacteraceae bacterium]
MSAAVFVYGTLLDPRVLEREAGRRGLARRLRPARLQAHRRVALRGTPYPTLVRDPRAAVDGAVLRLGPAAMARLGVYEGPLYRLRPVRVLTGRGKAGALAWMADARRADRSRAWPPLPRR